MEGYDIPVKCKKHEIQRILEENREKGILDSDKDVIEGSSVQLRLNQFAFHQVHIRPFKYDSVWDTATILFRKAIYERLKTFTDQEIYPFQIRIHANASCCPATLYIFEPLKLIRSQGDFDVTVDKFMTRFRDKIYSKIKGNANCLVDIDILFQTIEYLYDEEMIKVVPLH